MKYMRELPINNIMIKVWLDKLIGDMANEVYART